MLRRKVEITIKGTPENKVYATSGMIAEMEYKDLKDMVRTLDTVQLKRLAQAVHGALYELIDTHC